MSVLFLQHLMDLVLVRRKEEAGEYCDLDGGGKREGKDFGTLSYFENY